MTRRPTIVVLDHGSPSSQLVTRRLRTLGVFSEAWPLDRASELERFDELVGIVVCGGEVGSLPPATLDLECPLLAVGDGARVLCAAGGVDPPARDALRTEVETLEVEGETLLLRGTPRTQPVWCARAATIDSVPSGFEVFGRLESDGTIAIFADEGRRLFGVSFHPEASASDFGMQLLENFVRQICHVGGAWDRRRFLEEECDAIARRTEGHRVLCPVSGGVDSLVAASLVQRATADRLVAVFVDTGLLRHREPEAVTRRLGQILEGRLVTVDATDVFLDRLAGVADAEEKRRVIERTFVEVIESTAREHGPFDFLVQGTLYPDRIDGPSTGREQAYTDLPRAIRGLPESLGIEILEPLAKLFREDVRVVGRELGLPGDLLNRHPFPRSGLAIRVLGPVDRESVERVRVADHIFLEELRNADLYDRIWQAGCILLPVQTAGLRDDERIRARPIVLRAVTSVDAVSADWARIPDDVLARVSRRILREVDGITRVVYDISPKPRPRSSGNRGFRATPPVRTLVVIGCRPTFPSHPRHDARIPSPSPFRGRRRRAAAASARFDARSEPSGVAGSARGGLARSTAPGTRNA